MLAGSIPDILRSLIAVQPPQDRPQGFHLDHKHRQRSRVGGSLQVQVHLGIGPAGDAWVTGVSVQIAGRDAVEFDYFAVWRSWSPHVLLWVDVVANPTVDSSAT
jgi:hypothetical protein